MTNQEILQRAAVALRANDYELAERHAHHVIEVEPEARAPYVILGNIYTRQRRYPEALKAYQRSVDPEAENPESHNNIAVVHRQMGNLPAALKEAEKAHKIAPDRGDICYNLANFHKQAGNVDDAVRWYERAIQLNPASPLPYNNLGTLFEQRGDRAKALEYYRRGLAADGNSPTLRYNLGVALDAQGDTEQAAAEFGRALRTRPAWTDGLNNLGITLQKLGKDEDAVRAFGRILKAEPANAKAKNNLAVSLSNQGKHEEALRYYEEAIRDDPSYERAALNLGQLYEEQGVHEKAAQSLRALLERDGDNAEIRLRLGHSLLQQGKYREAAALLKAVLEANSEHVQALVEMGDLHRRIGKTDRALTYLLRAQRISPDDPDVRLHLAQAYKDRNDLERAIAELSFLLKNDQSNFSAKLLLGELYLQRNMYEEALGLFTDLLEQFPDHEEVLSATVRTYNAMGDQEQAIQYAERLVNLQGEGDNEDDLDNMQTSLQMYEQIVNDYSEDHEELWERNLRELTTLSERSVDEDEEMEEESLLFEGLPDLDKETVPIIEVGGLAPVIMINEEEDTLDLIDMEEDLVPILGAEDEEKDEIHVTVTAVMPEDMPRAAPPPQPQTSLPQQFPGPQSAAPSEQYPLQSPPAQPATPPAVAQSSGVAPGSQYGQAQSGQTPQDYAPEPIGPHPVQDEHTPGEAIFGLQPSGAGTSSLAVATLSGGAAGIEEADELDLREEGGYEDRQSLDDDSDVGELEELDLDDGPEPDTANAGSDDDEEIEEITLTDLSPEELEPRSSEDPSTQLAVAVTPSPMGSPDEEPDAELQDLADEAALQLEPEEASHDPGSIDIPEDTIMEFGSSEYGKRDAEAEADLSPEPRVAPDSPEEDSAEESAGPRGGLLTAAIEFRKTMASLENANEEREELGESGDAQAKMPPEPSDEAGVERSAGKPAGQAAGQPTGQAAGQPVEPSAEQATEEPGSLPDPDEVLRRESLKRLQAGSLGLKRRLERRSGSRQMKAHQRERRNRAAPPLGPVESALGYLKGMSRFLPNKPAGLALSRRLSDILGRIRSRSHDDQ